MGDKAVGFACVLIVAGWVGYQVRDREASSETVTCSPWQEGGRPLMQSIHEASGRVLCVYADPMPSYEKRSGRGRG